MFGPRACTCVGATYQHETTQLFKIARTHRAKVYPHTQNRAHAFRIECRACRSALLTMQNGVYQSLDEFQMYPTHLANSKGQKVLPSEFARSKADFKNALRPYETIELQDNPQQSRTKTSQDLESVISKLLSVYFERPATHIQPATPVYLERSVCFFLTTGCVFFFFSSTSGVKLNRPAGANDTKINKKRHIIPQRGGEVQHTPKAR